MLQPSQQAMQRLPDVITQLIVVHETVALTRPGHIRSLNLCAHAVLVRTGTT